ELDRHPLLEAAERVQERRLRRVLGLFAVAQTLQAVVEDLPAVALVEVVRRPGGCLCGAEPRGRRTAYGRDCCHPIVLSGHRPPNGAVSCGTGFLVQRTRDF